MESSLRNCVVASSWAWGSSDHTPCTMAGRLSSCGRERADQPLMQVCDTWAANRSPQGLPGWPVRCKRAGLSNSESVAVWRTFCCTPWPPRVDSRSPPSATAELTMRFFSRFSSRRSLRSCTMLSSRFLRASSRSMPAAAGHGTLFGGHIAPWCTPTRGSNPRGATPWPAAGPRSTWAVITG